MSSRIALPPLPASQIVLQLMEPDDTMTVWGWRSEHHVETQLPIGMRVSVSYLLIEDYPLREFFREENLRVFKKKKPAFFIDAVTPSSFWYKDPEKESHEIFPELAAFVRANYAQVADIEGVRIYLRKDRFEKVLRKQAAGFRLKLSMPRK